MKFHIRTKVGIPREEFWQLRAEEEYLALFKEFNHVEKVEVLEEWTDKDGTNHRLQSFTPKLHELPDVAKSLIADTATVVASVREHLSWNDDIEPYVQYFQSAPTVLNGLVTSSGWMRMDEDGEDSCVQIVEGDVNVRMPVVGYMCEECIVDNLRKFYKTTFRKVTEAWKERHIDCIPST